MSERKLKFDHHTPEQLYAHARAVSDTLAIKEVVARQYRDEVTIAFGVILAFAARRENEELTEQDRTLMIGSMETIYQLFPDAFVAEQEFERI